MTTRREFMRGGGRNGLLQLRHAGRGARSSPRKAQAAAKDEETRSNLSAFVALLTKAK
jgi:hypothetical protein